MYNDFVGNYQSNVLEMFLDRNRGSYLRMNNLGYTWVR